MSNSRTTLTMPSFIDSPIPYEVQRSFLVGILASLGLSLLSLKNAVNITIGRLRVALDIFDRRK